MQIKKWHAAGLTPLLLLGLVPVSVAYSEVTYVRASDLYRLCIGDNVVNRSWCEGFISGELEIISNTSIGGIAVCVPPLMTFQKAVAIAKEWLANHPHHATEAASLAIARGFAEAFPCKK